MKTKFSDIVIMAIVMILACSAVFFSATPEGKEIWNEFFGRDVEEEVSFR